MTDNLRVELAEDEVPVAIEAATGRLAFWGRFRRSPMGTLGAVCVLLLYLSAIFADFLAQNDPAVSHVQHVHQPPQLPHVRHNGQWRMPFVYPMVQYRSDDGLERHYRADTENPLPLRLFVKGESPYRLLGFLPANRHLIGVADGHWFPLGTDRMGRDLLARILHGGRVSLTIGLAGVAISMALGTLIGLASGYFGGWADMLTQRLIELLMSFPSIPLWIALAAAIPPQWSPVRVYLGIVVILSLIGWGGLARQVRGMTLSLRERDYVKAARSAGASHSDIILRHLLPGLTGYLIIIATIGIPGTILGETALSFLGLGIRSPMISWGVLLEEAQKVRVLVQFPWLLLPALPVLLTVISFNLVGDAIRDAIDPRR